MLYNQIAVCYIAHPNFPDGDWSWIRMGPSLGMTAPPAVSLPGRRRPANLRPAAFSAPIWAEAGLYQRAQPLLRGTLRAACKPLPLIREGGSGGPAASS